MRNAALARRADELAAQGAAYVTATVVRAQRPTSAHAGDVALVTSAGTIQGFVGGICAEHSVRLFAWTAMKTGEPILLRILPTAPEDAKEQEQEEGAMTVLNTCLSGGAIEVFLEPFLPIPRVSVVGSKPIAAQIKRLGSEFDLDIVASGDEPADVREGDLGLIVAAHGKGELEALRAGVEAGLPYVGLVASPKRGAALIDELREAGVPEEQLALIECPAGIDINAKQPPEVALSIIARLIERRHSDDYKPPLRAPTDQQAPEFAVDPVCGMTVTVEPGALQLEHHGETVYFCAPGCKKTYEREHMSAGPSAAAPAVKATSAPATAVDPICGMTVLAVAETPHAEHDGETVYFCCDGCKAKFEEQHAVAAG
ncbi:MAG: xanthine dehydrogenase accessory factor [Solirubrobacteraceae bacterium]|nr:xanthine dehydrogenase accessory factor [Solirubrobacteraceae bacterium]